MYTMEQNGTLKGKEGIDAVARGGTRKGEKGIEGERKVIFPTMENLGKIIIMPSPDPELVTIGYGSQTIELRKEVCESQAHFLKRMEFFVYALELGHSLGEAETLCFAYRNKLQSYMLYPPETERAIKKVMEEMDK